MSYFDRLPAKFMHPADLRAQRAEAAQRYRDRQDAAMPRGRVYQVIGDSSPLPEVGDVTQSSNSAIVWNPRTKLWEHATPETYGRKLDSKAGKRGLALHSQTRTNNNLHKGGNF